VAEKCPECGSPYLLEKHLKSGSMLVCPNNTRKSAEEEEPKPRKKRGKKGAAAEEAKPAAATVKCDYSRSIPTPEWMTQQQSGAAQREAG
jgi:DNA topoisomerase-1